MKLKKIIIGGLLASLPTLVFANKPLFLLCKHNSHGETWHLIGGPYNKIADCDRVADRHRDYHSNRGDQYPTVQCSWRTQSEINDMLYNGRLSRW